MDFPNGSELGNNDDGAGDSRHESTGGDHDWDLADELAGLVAEQQQIDGYAARFAADLATLQLGTPSEFSRMAKVALRNAVTILDRVLPQLKQHRIAHPALRNANIVAKGTEYDLPLMDDAIGRTLVALNYHIEAPTSPFEFVSMREINQVVRDRQLSQDAKSIAAIGMYDAASACVQQMQDLRVVADTIESVALDNLTYGDVDPLVNVARYHPNLPRQRHLIEYLCAVNHASRQPFDQAYNAVVDPDNPFVPRLERDLATVRAAYLSAMTDPEFAMTYLNTLPHGPVRDAATLPIVRDLGTDNQFNTATVTPFEIGIDADREFAHRIAVMHFLRHDDATVRAKRAAHLAIGCGTNYATRTFRWFRNEVATHDPSLAASSAWLDVYFARGFMRLSYAEFRTALALSRAEADE